METPMVVAWDVIVRAWLVAAAWLALRRGTRPAGLARLAGITDPTRFVRAAIVPAAGHVALAIALLPRRRRGEAMITLLACKALRAIEQSGFGGERAAEDILTTAITYLSGESHDPPRVDHTGHTGHAGHAGPTRGAGAGTAARPIAGIIARGSASRIAAHGPAPLDRLLVARLPLLRAALETLPGDAVRRCRTMIERVGESIIRARGERRGSAAHLLGEAVVYAARLAAPSVRPPDAACRATGRALQLADDLRTAESAERRSWLVSRTLPATSEVVRLARWLPASVGPGTRAAAALLVATSCAALLREAGVAPRHLHRPLRAAWAAAWSHGAYLAGAAAIDGAIHDALAAHPSLLDQPAIVPVRPAAPDAVAPPPALVALAIELVPPRGSDAGELRELTRIGS